MKLPLFSISRNKLTTKNTKAIHGVYEEILVVIRLCKLCAYFVFFVVKNCNDQEIEMPFILKDDVRETSSA